MDVVDQSNEGEPPEPVDVLDILAQADAVVSRYTETRLQEAARHQEACGCRSCTAAGNRWLEWLAGDDAELYERIRFHFKWEASALS